MKRFLCVVLAVMLLLSLAACSPKQPQAETGVEGDALPAGEKITIVSADSSEKDIFIADIMKLPVTEKEVISVNSAGNENKFTVKGALLSDVLRTLGMDQKSLSSIRLVAGDGYMMEVPPEVLAARDIIIAYEIDGEPLQEKTRPARIIIPEERAMYWVRNLVKIEILQARKALSLIRLLFLETALQNFEQHDYTYYESLDKAVTAADFFRDIAMEGSSDTVHMKAVDGLEKNEKTEVFENGYIKITGVDTPAFVSPEIPKGMYVKNILWFAKSDTGYISYTNASGYFPTSKVDDREGIRLSDVFSEVSMDDGEAYLFTAIDGYSIEIEKEDIAKGLIFLRDSGEVSVMFEGLPKNTSVRGLLSVETVK
jgi:hypothetical protein